MAADVLAPAPVDLGALSEFEDGTPTEVMVGQVPVVAVRVGDEMHVLGARCPHRGARIAFGCTRLLTSSSEPGTIDLDEATRVVVCPWHGFEFDVATGAPVAPGVAALRTYEATVVDGRVLARLRRSASSG